MAEEPHVASIDADADLRQALDEFKQRRHLMMQRICEWNDPRYVDHMGRSREPTRNLATD